MNCRSNTNSPAAVTLQVDLEGLESLPRNSYTPVFCVSWGLSKQTLQTLQESDSKEALFLRKPLSCKDIAATRTERSKDYAIPAARK